MPPPRVLDSAGVLSGLLSLVSGLSGLQEVVLGPPASMEYAVTAYITLLGGPIENIAVGITREGRARVTFGYRVPDRLDTREETVSALSTLELMLAQLVDAFTVAFYADRTLGGVTPNGKLDPSIASAQEFESVAGQEYRRYPIDVIFDQQQAITIP